MEQSGVVSGGKKILENGGGKLPIGRALIANVILTFAAIIIVFIIMASRQLSFPIIVELLAILVIAFPCIRIYNSFVARIIINEQGINVVRSINTIFIPRSSIDFIKMNRSRIFATLKIIVYNKEKKRKWIFRSAQYIGKSEMSELISSWWYPICTLNEKSLVLDDYAH
jgi:hypothetical protein